MIKEALILNEVSCFILSSRSWRITCLCKKQLHAISYQFLVGLAVLYLKFNLFYSIITKHDNVLGASLIHLLFVNQIGPQKGLHHVIFLVIQHHNSSKDLFVFM
jgi:hypothetical protein